jgi:hypothetical protein
MHGQWHQGDQIPRRAMQGRSHHPGRGGIDVKAPEEHVVDILTVKRTFIYLGPGPGTQTEKYERLPGHPARKTLCRRLRSESATGPSLIRDMEI